MTQRWLKRGFSLRLALVLFLALPLVVLLALVSWSGMRGLENRVESQMQKDIELIARAIRGPLEHALEFDRQRSLDRTLSSAFRFSEVYGVYVYDREGRRVAASGPAEPEVQRQELVQLAADGDRLGAYDEADGEAVFSYFVPLSDSVGRNLGLLQLTRDGSQFQDYIRQARHQALLLLSLFSLSLLALVLFAHHRIIGTQLTALADSMARIAAGDRRHRTTPSGPTEIRQLARGMNTMLDSIAAGETQLARQREEQRQLEERLRQSEKMAAIGGLAAGVAHELGTPLSLVAGKAQRRLRREQSQENAAAFQEIRQAVERMSHIVRQLLDFGRDHQPRRKQVEAGTVATNAADQVREAAGQAGVEIRLTGPQPPPRLHIDPIRLEQALSNLLLNAVQALEAQRQQPEGTELNSVPGMATVGDQNGDRFEICPLGRVRGTETGTDFESVPSDGGSAKDARPTVQLSWFGDDQQAGFRVEDNGPGIARELYPRLFEPFFTTKEVGRGTGLGLAVAHSAVQDHGGQIEVGNSELGGACFTITLPR